MWTEVEKEKMDKQKALEEKIRFQVECEKKAHFTVQKLLDNPITEDLLIESGRLIKPEHYDDVTEERAISHQCGYPICPNTLTNVPRQRFHISTRTNKVYDIQQRKNFCSNECYNASNYFKSQLSSSPLWMRKNQNIPILKLLSKPQARGKCGEEVVSITEEIQAEVRVLEKPISSDKNKSPDDGDRNAEVLSNDRDMKREKEVTEAVQHSMDKMTISDERGCIKSTPSKVVNKSVSKSKKEEGTSVKMASLMSLLDRRKNLLGKIAQIENVSADGVQSGRESKYEKERVSQTESIVPMIKCVNDTENKNAALSENDQSQTEKDSVTGNVTNADSICDQQTHTQTLTISGTSVVCVSTTAVTVCRDSVTKSDHSESKVNTSTRQKNTKIQTQIQKAPSVSVLQCICDILKTWITEDTREFLRVDTKANSVSDDSEHSERIFTSVENQEGYKRLCQKLDAEETELDLQEDVTLVSELPHNHSQTPDYHKLRTEVDDFAVKIQQFYGGKNQQENFIKEKSSAFSTPVYLPSVDSHDQMLIRQRIVMERLHKVMPEFLPPLHLSIQDVFTPLKQLVSTFRLGSKNISFRPAQWTLVALMLLKMLSCRELKIACAFTGTSAVQFFTIMLHGVGESLENIDVYVTNILSQ